MSKAHLLVREGSLNEVMPGLWMSPGSFKGLRSTSKANNPLEKWPDTLLGHVVPFAGLEMTGK